jgi:radical SAM superfamily enzyme
MPNVKRVFLEHGDAFVLNAERLEKIADLIHEKLPKVETISMYASILNIRNKTDEELLRLRECGINELDIGVESGFDTALTMMNKGYTNEESVTQLLRLKKAGMDFSLNVILGCAGADLWKENAEATADMLNSVQPHLLFIGTLHADKGCQLYFDMQSGVFKECTYGQLLDEQELLIRKLELNDTIYFGSHPSNVVPMEGYLPLHKEEMLDVIQKTRERLHNRLNTYPLRAGEGSILDRK